MNDKTSIYVYARHLRKNQTKAEKIFWKKVRAKRLNGYKIRRQHPIGRLYIADFYCPCVKLVIEIDGPIHDEKAIKENDKIRQNTMIQHGYEVIRFSNELIYSNLDLALNTLLKKIESLK